MPFDNTTGIITAKQPAPDPKEAALKHIKALERLLKLSEQATDIEQLSYQSCLWYRAAWDKELSMLGLIKALAPSVSNPATVFGDHAGPDTEIWGTGSVLEKKQVIRNLIKHERRQVESVWTRIGTDLKERYHAIR